MAENIDLALNLDASGYAQGASQVAAANQQMSAGFDGVERKTGMVAKAMQAVTPGRAMIASWTGVTAAAGAWEQQLGGMQATAKVTDQSMRALQSGVAGLARTFPVGNKAALEVVSTLQSIGYSGKQQIGTINDLGKAYIRLGAATGQNASMIGRQMTQLNRAFGASDNNTKRFEKMSDSLTTVTAKIGGSAGDILAFSKNIAPMARSAGLGQTAVMGISAAFSKMGEDGYTASNAMVKMLTDMNRSVRDGSSEMGTYANIVGKTREEFEALFKAKPDRALSEVLAQLGGGGPGTERNLERLGLDGVRTARALQGLSQQGGTQAAISTAVGAYGNNKTRESAAAAMDGLFDEFGKLRSASEQVTEALGRPFLGAITKIVGVASTPMKGAAAVLDSSAMQKVMQIGLPLIAGYLGMRAMGALGLTAALGRNLVNNGIVGGLREGRRMGADGRLVAGPVSNAANQGRLAGMGTYGRVAQGALNVGRGFGMAQARLSAEVANRRFDQLVARGMSTSEAAARVTAPRPSIGQQLRAGLRAAPGVALNTAAATQRIYNRAMQESARMLREPDPTMRRLQSQFQIRRQGAPLAPGAIGPVGPATGAFGKLSENLKTIHSQSLPLSQRITMMGAAMGRAGTDALVGGRMVQTAAGMVRNSLANTAIGLRALGATAAATGLGRGAMAAGRMLLNPMMLAMVGGTALFSNISGNKGARKQEQEDLQNRSITASIDEYRNSMGAATDATQTFAQQVQTATEALMRNVATTKAASEVTAADVSYAEQTKGKVVQKFGGDNESIANQARLMSPGGMKPMDLQALKVDLLKQRSVDDVREIMSLIQGGKSGTAGVDYTKIFTGDMAKQTGQGGMDKFRRGFLGQGGSNDNSWQSVVGAGAGMGIAQGITEGLDKLGFGGKGDADAVGRGNNKAKITSTQQNALNQVTSGIAQERTANEDQYGPEYARQQQLRSANKAFEAVLATKNKDLIARASQDLTETIGSKDQSTLISADDVKKHGGFVQAFQAMNGDFGKNTAGVDLNPTNGTAGLAATLTDSAITKATAGIDLFSTALSNRTKDVETSLNKTVKAFLDLPGDMSKLRTAVTSTVASGEAAGMSLNQVAEAAAKTAARLNHDPTSDVVKYASAVFEKAVQTNEENAGFQGSAVTSSRRLGFARSLMENAGTTEQGQQNYERGRQMMMSERENLRQRLVGRLQQERQYQVQVRRTEIDFYEQRKYAYADYHKGIARAEEDFGIQRGRAVRDFNIGIANAEEDFRTARMRAQRDFNKQMRRMNEDAAKGMYDPYKRIQVEAVTDLQTLAVNVGEQTQAMVNQRRQLDELRKRGVNNETIDQLGLGKAEHAQQLDRVLGDLMSGAMTPQALNKMIADRMKAAANLNQDPSNKEISRAKEDFAQSLKDQDADFAKSMKRNRAEFTKSMNDAAADYQRSLARNEKDFLEGLRRQSVALHKGLARQRQDIDESQKEILGSLETLQSAVLDSMSGKAVDFRTLMSDTLKGTMTDVEALVAKYPGFWQGIMGDPNNVQNSTNAGFSGRGGAGMGDGVGMGYQAQTRALHEAFPNAEVTSDYRPGAKTVSGNLSLHGAGRAIDIAPSWQVFNWLRETYPNSKELIWTPAGREQLKDGRSHVYGPSVAKGHYDHIHWAMAKGGIAKGGLGGLNTTVAEAGSNEAVIPLDTRGVSVLAQAMTQYMTGPDAQRLLTGGKGDRVTYTGNTFIEDHSLNINGGQFTVQADDPNAMMRALDAKVRAANMTATPTRKGR